MHTIMHTLIRNGSVYYNLRIPPEAYATYHGAKLIRFKLGELDRNKPNYIDHNEVEEIVGRLTPLLQTSFRTGCKIDYKAVAKGFKPKSRLLTDMADEYLQIRGIDPKPTKIALEALTSISGNKDIAEYTREDARQFLHYITARGVKTATIRRRISSICAVINYAFAEFDVNKRNPFAQLFIKGEGKDANKRGTFTTEQLKQGYDEALDSGSCIRLLVPILGETGCRLAEVVGLRVEDVDLQESVLHIRPHAHRRLKTAGSERTLPLLGYAEMAVRRALSMRRDDNSPWLFPRYYKPTQGVMATHASNAINKWMKVRFDGMTAHCLRHTMRDRLRAADVPLEAIDQIGGWSSVGGVGTRYGKGYDVEKLRSFMEPIILNNP